MHDSDNDSADDAAAGPAALGGADLGIRPDYRYTGRLQAGAPLVPTNPLSVAQGDGGMSLSKRPYQKGVRGASSNDSMLGDLNGDDDDATESDGYNEGDDGLGGGADDDNGPAAGGKKRKLLVDSDVGPLTFARLPYPLEYSETSIDPRTIGTYKEVLLRSDSTEFQRLKNLFERNNNSKIFKIYRVEDPLKLAIFQLELASLKEKHNPDPIPVETLYHSTSNSEKYSAILKDNFSMKYCSRGMLGSGIYFSQQPRYSMDSLYSDIVRVNYGSIWHHDDATKLELENLARTRIMLACDVILGKTLFISSKSGDHADMVAPIEHFHSHGFHETTLGYRHDIFCVFSNKRILPKYVIYYDNSNRPNILPSVQQRLQTINTLENLTATNSQYPIQERVPDSELKRQYGNDRELVVELQNTPRKQMYSYANQRSSNEYDLVVNKFE